MRPGKGMWLYLVCVAFPGLSLHLGLTATALAPHPRAMEIDARLLTESAKWEKVLERFSDKEMNEMHLSFLKKSAGQRTKKEITKNVIKNKEKTSPPKSAFLLTKKALALIAKKNFLLLK